MTALPLNVDGPALDQLLDGLAERVAVRLLIGSAARTGSAGSTRRPLRPTQVARSIRFIARWLRGRFDSARTPKAGRRTSERRGWTNGVACSYRP
jgi:hypothetical protein